MPSTGGGGGEESEVQRPDVFKAGFNYWCDPDTIVAKAKDLPGASLVNRTMVWVGGIINDLWSDTGRAWIHTGLDIAAMIPYVGSVADVCNAGIYFYEGKYLEGGLRLASAAATVVTGLPVANAASKGLKALGASEKVAEKLGCVIGTAVNAAPHAATALLSVAQGNRKLNEGKYLEAALSYVGAGASVFRAWNVGTFCFVEGTQVVVGMEYDPDGNFVSYVTVNIEDVNVGDLVYSYDTATGEVSQKAVTSTSALRSDHINKLTIIDEDGNEQIIETTDTHPFWVVTDEPDLERAVRSVVDENGAILYHENIEPGLNGFWVEAKDLRIGDVFLGANGELSTLTNIVRVEQEGGIAVFNFTVEGNHNYFILAKEFEYGQTCVLVHNAKVCTPQEGDIMTYREWENYRKKNGAGNLTGHHPVASSVLIRERYNPNMSPVLIMDKNKHLLTVNHGTSNSHHKWSLTKAIDEGLNDNIVAQVAGKRYKELQELIIGFLFK